MIDRPRYRKNPVVGETRIENDVFLVEPGSDDVFYLDATGAALWRLLSEPQTQDEIEAVFAAAFPDVPRDRLERDLAALLADLTGRKLVVPVE
jgi:Coenzyme PQQ synthesis protein D (PqqD)